MIDFDRAVLYIGIAAVMAVATFNHLHAPGAWSLQDIGQGMVRSADPILPTGVVSVVAAPGALVDFDGRRGPLR